MKDGVPMTFPNADKFDEFDNKAARHLKSDKSWRWKLSPEETDDLIKKYKSAGRNNTIAYLALDVMGYCAAEDENDAAEDEIDAVDNKKIGCANNATNQFLKVRKKISRTSGWAIFCLACELHVHCNIEIGPFDIAEPTGSKKEKDASNFAMNHLWNNKEYKKFIESVAPAVQAAFKEEGGNETIENIQEIFINNKRLEFRRLLSAILFPFPWLYSKISRASRTSQVIGITTVLFAAVLIPLLLSRGPTANGDSQFQNSKINSTSVTSEVSEDKFDRNQLPRVRVIGSTSDNIQIINDTDNVLGSVLPAIHDDNDTRVQNLTEYEESSVDFDNSNLSSLKKQKKEIQTADIHIGIDIEEGGFTLAGIDNRYTLTFSGEKCNQPLPDEKYYVCHIMNLPAGKYRISFWDVPGYATPSTREIELASLNINILANYMSSSIGTTNLQIVLGDDVSYFGVTSYAKTESGHPIFKIQRTRDMCKKRGFNGRILCDIESVPWGAYRIDYFDQENYPTDLSENMILLSGEPE